MTKLRLPDSFEHAITEIRAVLGDNECARVTQKSPSLILKASDPDNDYMLPLDIALALDMAYFAKTNDMPPIMRFWAKCMDMAQMAKDPKELDIIQCALFLQKENGDFASRIAEFTNAASQSGSKLSRNECLALLNALDGIEAEVATAKMRLHRQIEKTGRAANDR